MPTNTLKRSLPTVYRGSRWRANGVSYTGGTLVLAGDQETTSYRSTGSASDVVQDAIDEYLAYNPFTGAGQPRSVNSLHDKGHEFFTVKRQQRLSHPSFYTQGPRDWFHGPLNFTNVGQTMAYPTVARMSQNDIRFYGAKAIKATTPTQPTANVAQMIGELVSDGLPITGSSVLRLADQLRAAMKNPTRGPRGRSNPTLRDFVTGVGDGSLMLQFGVEPLVRDFADIMFAVSTAAQRIEQWYRDSGRQVRRSWRLPPITSVSTSVLTGGPAMPPITSGGGGLQVARTGFSGPVTLDQSIRQDIWFSGAYMYYATVGETVLEKIMQAGREADLILGGKFTYETLWELAPWSWLIDWKANIGDAISNMTRFSADKLVLRYGYLMRTTSVTNTYTAKGMSFYDRDPGPLLSQFSVVQKERYRATPYGFGIDPGSFSSNQWQILAMLGLSKGGKALP